jgi:glutamate dehydrogenase/leucine dehydrogenase
MNWIKDTYETLEGTTAPGVVTGKGIESGGSEGRLEATGRSVMLTAREAFRYRETPLDGVTVAVQGYGNAGAVAARLLDEEGADVVAVSDSTGAVHDPDGLDAQMVKEHKKETGSVTGYVDAAEELTGEGLLTLDVDLLIPAALENAIDETLAEEVRADVIVEAANGPLTPAADDTLIERDVSVFPDVLANAGGVTVSYFEWVQNRRRFYWDEQRVNDELETVIVDAFDRLIEVFEEYDLPNLRTAAYAVAIDRIVDAHAEGGTWP